MYTLNFSFDKIIQIFLAAIFVWIKFVTYIFNYFFSERWILWILIHSYMWHLVFSTDLLRIKHLKCSNIKYSIITRDVPAFYHIWICDEFFGDSVIQIFIFTLLPNIWTVCFWRFQTTLIFLTQFLDYG